MRGCKVPTSLVLIICYLPGPGPCLRAWILCGFHPINLEQFHWTLILASALHFPADSWVKWSLASYTLAQSLQGLVEDTLGCELWGGVDPGNFKPFCELLMSLNLEVVCPCLCLGDEVMSWDGWEYWGPARPSCCQGWWSLQNWNQDFGFLLNSCQQSFLWTYAWTGDSKPDRWLRDKLHRDSSCAYSLNTCYVPIQHQALFLAIGTQLWTSRRFCLQESCVLSFHSFVSEIYWVASSACYFLDCLLRWWKLMIISATQLSYSS